MIPGLYFTYGFVALLLVVNARRRPVPPRHPLPPLYLPAMITSEMAGLWLVVAPAAAAAAWWAGAMESRVGLAGSMLLALAWVGQITVWRRSRTGAAAVGDAVDLPRHPLSRALSVPGAIPPDIERTEHHYAHHPHRARPLRLDLYTDRVSAGPRPLVIHVHGGGWRGGHPRQAGQTILHHLARSGWVVASIEYPLSPEATFPEHLFGIDAAHAWLTAKQPVAGPVILMGASAGAHLAAVAGLTRSWVHGVVGLYGIYDFLNRDGLRPDWPLIPEMVMKTTPEADPELYRSASPFDLAHPGAPPFLLVHGTHDSVVPLAESAHFAHLLRSHGVLADVLEVPWAQHGFDARAGRRARAVAGRIEDWLATTVLSSSRDGPHVRHERAG